MVLAQTILVLPVVTALTRQAIEDADRAHGEQLRSLGAGSLAAQPAAGWDERYALLTVVIAAFGRAVSEVGAVMIVGGNIDGFTRVMTPASRSKTAKTRVGRGEGSKGKTAGRGTKGTKARKNVPATFEGGQMPIHMRLPKLKGFRNRFRTEYEVVNVGDINRLFPKGGEVGVDELVAAGAVRKNSLVKVLGDGKLTVKVNVTAHKFSGSAREKISAAGGSATEL